MNDAERDAWLREALRHAPDSAALPPREISEAILAQARAAARVEAASPARSARASATQPLAAFWAWLARPGVAAGFASVMAATLVGLMWWDRPMDETLPRPPAAASEQARAPTASEGGAPARPSQSALSRADESDGAKAAGKPAATMQPQIPDVAAALGKTAPARRHETPSPGATARDDKQQAALPPNEERKRADALAKKETTPSAPKLDAPAAFPQSDEGRRARATTPSLRANKASKDDDASAAPPREAMTRTDAVAAKSALAAAPSAANSANAEVAKDTPAPVPETALPRMPATAPVPAAGRPPVPATTPAAMPSPALRSGALGELHERQASSFASSSPTAAAAPARSDLAAARRARTAAAAPLAPVLGALAREPERWSRTTSSGSAVALDTGWRDWLTQLDAAATGRWRPLTPAGAAATDTGRDATTESERAGATTVRLSAPDRPPLVVRLEGATVRIDGPLQGERWQAILPDAAAERLRAAAERLPP